MTDDDEVIACPDCDRTPVVANAPGGRSHGGSEDYRCARCGWKGDEPRRRESRGDPDLRPDSLAAKLDQADSLDELVTDGGVDRPDGGVYHVGDAVEVLDDLQVSASLVHLDDAWARPGRQGAFGVEYPTHDFETTTEIVDASWEALEPGGWLICDADDWLAPRLEDYIREEFGDVTAYGDYQGGGYRRPGSVTYVDASGEPDESTAGQYLSNGGYPVIFAHKADTDRRATASARQLARQPRRIEPGYPYGRGSIKPLAPYREWVDALTAPGELVLAPCAGTAPAAIAAEELGREWVAIDIDEDARRAFRKRLEAIGQNQTTLSEVTAGD